MARPHLEVADILAAHGDAYVDRHRGHLSRGQLKVISAIRACRTAAGDPGLPHGGARRPCRALRELRPPRHRLQLLP
jgi:hypothetical protein